MLKVFRESPTEYSVFLCINDSFNEDELDLLEEWLIQNNNFKQGKTSWDTKIPRDQIWYQKEKKYFCKEWTKKFPRWESEDYEEILIKIQTRIQNLIKILPIYYPGVKLPQLNSCLINKYIDNRCSIKPHKDTYLSFGDNPTILGLSIGGTRKIKIKRVIYDPNNKDSINLDYKNQDLNLDLTLNHGSIFIMAGGANKYFCHEIEKTNKHADERHSLTFREYIK